MAVFWTESFATDAFPYKLTPNGTKVDIQAINFGHTTPRTGSNYGRSESGGGAAGWYIPALGSGDADDYLIVGHAIRYPSLPAAEQNVMLFWGDGPSGSPSSSGTTKHIQITIGSDHKIRAYRGWPSGTLLGTSASPAITEAGQWYYIEVKVKLSDTVGVVEVRINKTAVLSLSGIDTKNGGTVPVIDRVSVDADGWFDKQDIVFINSVSGGPTDYIGDVQVFGRNVNGNGATSNGVGSDGNSTDNYLLVDDATSTSYTTWGADYVDLQATNDKDTYAVENDSFGFPPSHPVYGVGVWAYAKKTDIGARGLSVVSRLSGTEVTIATAALATGDQLVGGIFQKDPSGGDWTVSSVDSAEVGEKAT